MGNIFGKVRCVTCKKEIFGSSHAYPDGGCRCTLCYYRFRDNPTTEGICNIEGCYKTYYSTNEINVCTNHLKLYYQTNYCNYFSNELKLQNRNLVVS